MHELLNELVIEDGNTESDNRDTKEVEFNNESSLLVNSTTGTNVNPGDFRKLMSSPTKSKPSPSSTKKAMFKSEITTNGKTYREVEKHVIC